MKFDTLNLPLGPYSHHRTYFDHDSVPLLFSLKAQNSSGYALGNVVDETENTLSIVFALLNDDQLLSVEKGEVPLRSAFTQPLTEKVFYVEYTDGAYDNNSLSPVPADQVSEEWLPQEGACLGSGQPAQGSSRDGLYKFFWDCGRAGSLEGAFIADSADIASILGKEVYFGEALGKHSEIYGIVEADDIELVSDDSAVVSALRGFSVGYNPLDYLQE